MTPEQTTTLDSALQSANSPLTADDVGKIPTFAGAFARYTDGEINADDMVAAMRALKPNLVPRS